jgi:hypothetical protein
MWMISSPPPQGKNKRKGKEEKRKEEKGKEEKGKEETHRSRGKKEKAEAQEYLKRNEVKNKGKAL